MTWKQVSRPLSNTQIQMYQRCPKQYEYRYLKGLKIPPNQAIVVGASVHKAIELNYGTKFETSKAAKKADTLDAYNNNFESQKHGAVFTEPKGKAKDRGYALAEKHYDEVAPTVKPVEKPELRFEIDFPGVSVKVLGFIDVIGSIGSKERVVLDNKTTSRKKTKFEVDLDTQLSIYAYAHKKLYGKKPDGLGFDVLIGNSQGESVQRIGTSRSEEQFKQLEETVLMIEKGISTGVFPPTNNSITCSWCGYASMCPVAKVATKQKQAILNAR